MDGLADAPVPILLIVVAIFVASFVVAVRQGREFQVWPPRMGSKPPASPSVSEGKDSLSSRVLPERTKILLETCVVAAALPGHSDSGLIFRPTGKPGGAPNGLVNLASAHTVHVMYTTGESLLRHQSQQLATMLRNGGHLRVMVARPDGPFLSDVRSMETIKNSERLDLGIEVQSTISLLRQIRHSNPGVGLIEFGTYETHLRVSIIALDRKLAWLCIALPPARTPDSFGILTDDEKLLATVNEHLDTVWQDIPDERKLFI